MIYRMKQNAVGLANICIISTAVLVVISTTVSMFVGVDDTMNTMYPGDVNIDAYYSPEDTKDIETLSSTIKLILEEDNMSYTNFQTLNYLTFITEYNGNSYTVNNNFFTASGNQIFFMVIPLEEYNAKSNTNYELKGNEVLLYSNTPMSTIQINDASFTVKEMIQKLPFGSSYMINVIDTNYMIVPNMNALYSLYANVNDGSNNLADKINYEIKFDQIGRASCRERV